MLSTSTLDSGRADFFWPLIFRGVGLGLLFVPLTTLALSELRGRDIAQGAGLTNMMRQLGGSFGVALIATYIQKRSWAHRQNLLRTSRSTTPPLRERLAAITRGTRGRGLAARRGPAPGDRAPSRGRSCEQTFLLTYMDAFRSSASSSSLCIPLLLLFKRRRGGPVAVPLH